MSKDTRKAKPTEELDDLLSDSTKPLDVGGDLLPFDHLSGRRFESLAFLLRKATAQPDEHVTLIKASGDRGRDVVVHRAGQPIEIIQCKNQSHAMTSPEVVREVLKIALYAYLDRTLISEYAEDATEINVWCTGGFTEPATAFVVTWPRGWANPEVVLRFDEVREKYRSLGVLSWDAVEKFVLFTFPRMTTLAKRSGIELTNEIRRVPSIYEQFFSGNVVVKVEDAVTAFVRKLTSESWRPISDDGLRHITDRINSFSADERSYTGLGFMFGVPPQLFADMSDADRMTLLELISQAPVRVAGIFMNMANEKAQAILSERMAEFDYTSRSFLHIVNEALRLRALAQISGIIMPATSKRYWMKEMNKSELWDLLDGLCERAWADFVGILSPDFRPPTTNASDEQLRREIAQYATSGCNSSAQFIDELRGDCRRNLPLIRELVDQIEAYFPKDLLLISDSKSVFDHQELFGMLRATLAKFRFSADNVESD